MRYLFSSIIAACAVFFVVPSVSAAFITVDSCDDFATTTGPGDVFMVTSSFSCTGRITSEDIADVTVAGNGFTITLADDLGLFGAVEDATIQDLTLAGTIDLPGSSFGGFGTSASNTIVQNVTNTLAIQSSTSSYVGTSAAFFGSINGPVTLRHSVFSGSLNITGRFGLMSVFAAEVQGDVTFYNNTFTGSMTFNDDDGSGLLGMLGARVGISTSTALTVSSSNNTYNTSLTIISSTTTPNQINSVGQLFGDFGGQSGNNYRIIFNSTDDTIGGSVNVLTSALVTDMGAIAGTVSNRSTSTISGLTVTGAFIFNGPYLDSAAVSGFGGMGGSITWSDSTSTRSATLTFTHPSSSDLGEFGTWVGDLGGTEATLSSLTSSGDIIVSAPLVGGSGVFIDEIGGVVGVVDNNSFTATNIEHTGDITIETQGQIEEVGGIIGLTDGVAATTSYSLFSGDITVSSTDATEEIGGFVGHSSANMHYINVTSTGNLIVSGDYVDGIGGIVGYAGDDIWTNNVYVVGDITISNVSTSVNYVGGAFGDVSDDLFATSTYVTGGITITSDQRVYAVGGIVGIIDDYDAVIDTSVYSGTMTVNTDRSSYVGGIIGDFYYDYDLTLSNASSTGIVSTTARDILAYGGIIGGFSDYPEDVIMTNLTNGMNIVLHSTSSSPEVEGVAGIIGYHDDDDDDVYVMTNITNNGDITIYSAIENADVWDIGGIVGHYDAQDENEDLSTQIVNTGDITIYASASSTEVYNIGGIVGYIYDWFGMSDVTSTGDITIYAAATSTDVDDIGGFFGYSDDDTYTYNTRILSDITIYANGSNSDVSSVGGIAGTFEGYDWDVTSTYYTGTITVEGGYEIDSVAGILGELDEGNVTVSTTYAVADIILSLGQSSHNAVYRVGGFVGYEDDNMGVTNSFAAGSISITANTGSSASSVVVYDVGGFAGAVEDTAAVNTYADVDIDITTANDDVRYVGGYAGRVGQNEGDTEVSYSFAAGDIDITAGGSSSGVAGFIGDHVSSTLISNNYYDIYRTGQSSCEGDGTLDGCTGYNENNYAATSGRLVNNSSNAPVSSWDFDTVWQLDEDYYPVLAFVPYDGSITLGTGSESSGGGGFVVPPSVPRIMDTSDIIIDAYDDDQVAISAAFSINDGDTATDSTVVELNFTDIVNASQVAFSNSLDFSGISYQDFSETSYTHELTPGDGTKTVYARLRSSQGGVFTIKDTVLLQGQGFEQAESTTGADTCPLPTGSAAKSPASNAVYYITTECTKRAFSSSPKYFTYFTSWDDYTTTSPAILNSIPDDTLGFMPWGPRYNPASGALIKTPSDPKTYLLLDGTLYHIENEAAAAFQFGPAWATWIEDVDARLLTNYPLSSTQLDTTSRPDGILIKYTDDPKVYQLDTEDGTQVKRWIPDEPTFDALNFRDDRIVTVPSTEIYPDGTDLTS